MTNNLIKTEHSVLSYFTGGSGKNVVLIHGFGEDHRIWENFIPNLSSSCRLIIPDLPGTGKSTLPDEKDNHLEHYAVSIRTILTHENIQTCAMIGHSMGGYIALAFAAQYPDMLDSLGLFHSSAYPDDAEKTETRRKGIDFIKKNGASEFLKTSLPGLFFNPAKNQILIEILQQRGHELPGETLVTYYKAMMKRPDRTNILKTFSKPVLIILGIHDKAVPLDAGLKQATLPAQCHLHIFKESGHMGMLEEPQKANRVLAEFLHS